MEVSPEVQGTWLGCGAGLAGVIGGRLAGPVIGISIVVIVFWAGVFLLLWRFDRRH